MRIPPAHPLLTLMNTTARLEAGLPPRCRATVRLLDGAHLEVNAGECIVVHPDEPAGARVLLAALAGHAALLAGQSMAGERHCAPHVRVRRAAVRVGVLAPLLAGWRDGTASSASGHASHGAPVVRPPVVHLLRASREGVVPEAERQQWHRWACRERAAGGAVVIVAPPGGLGRRLASVCAPGAARRPRAQAVAEKGRPGDGHAGYGPSGWREVLLHHGRLVSVSR